MPSWYGRGKIFLKNEGANNLLQQIYLCEFTVYIRLYALVAAIRKSVSWNSATEKDFE